MTKKKTKKANVTKRIQCSDENTLSLYLKEINHIPLLTKEEEEQTAKLAVQGNKAAREKLVNSNLRFVIMIAKKYQGRGLSLEDLIGEGNVGLLKAIKNFKAEKGYRFITYAVWWIRQAIMKAIYEKTRMIRLPCNKAKDLTRIEVTRDTIQNNPGWESDDEVTEIARFLDMAPDKAMDLISISQEVISLDDPVSKYENSMTLKDLLEDNYQNISPVDKVINTVLKCEMDELINKLGDRAATVIRGRYGLGDSGFMTLKEIGANTNLSRERVRQIEKRALRILQNSTQFKRLKSYIA